MGIIFGKGISNGAGGFCFALLSVSVVVGVFHASIAGIFKYVLTTQLFFFFFFAMANLFCN